MSEGCPAPQEWTALRKQGLRTPDIAPWQRLPGAPNKLSSATRKTFGYPYVLNVLNTAAYSSVRT